MLNRIMGTIAFLLCTPVILTIRVLISFYEFRLKRSVELAKAQTILIEAVLEDSMESDGSPEEKYYRALAVVANTKARIQEFRS